LRRALVGVSASEGNEAANDSKVFVSSHLPHLAHYLSWGNEETRIIGSFWDIIKDMANRLEREQLRMWEELEVGWKNPSRMVHP
jgi:hypothetical protein